MAATAAARLSSAAVLVAAITLSATTRLAAQEGSCRQCRITVDSVGSIGGGDAEGSFPSFPTAMARDSQGRLFAAFSRHPPLAYSPRLEFLGPIGGIGDGPGETRRPSVVFVDQSDSVHVFDKQLGRHSVFAPSLRFVRSAPSISAVDAVALTSDHQWIFNASILDRDRTGLPFHAFDRNGRYVRSFGATDGRVTQSDDLSLTVRRLWAASTGGVWSVPWTHEYRIERWSSTGALLQSARPTTSWFRPYVRLSDVRVTPTRAPAGRVAAVFEDDQQRVWVLGHAAAVQWARGIGPAEPGEDGRLYHDITDRARVFDTMIEVYDARSLTLLVRHRVARPIDFALGNGWVAAIREDDDGRLRADILRLTLHR
jgi:hypothetical protein